MMIPSWQKTQKILASQHLEATTMPRITGENEIELNKPTQTHTPPVISKSTEMPAITSTPPTLDMERLFGDDIQFLIHRTRAGETLSQFSNQYNTNVDTIRAVNDNLPSVLYVDVVVVIPIGVDDPAGLPQFSAYEVTMRGMTLETLAQELSADPQTMSKYNNLPSDYVFEPGDWVLVPRD